jgi:GDP-4-dehydro-6-deoxy-D-mannose reductase
MKILITGGAGFIGSHLADFIVKKGFRDVYVGYWSGDSLENVAHLKGRARLVRLDINKSEAVRKFIARIKPDLIFHLAAQSYVTESWNRPKETLETNIIGTFNLYDAVIREGTNPVIITACSSAEYGTTTRDEIPIKENKEFRPISPYAVSKIAQDMLSLQYNKSHGLNIIRARLFNTIGARKAGNACSDFAKGIAEVEAGLSDHLSVGNLEPVVDFTDVKDTVRALWLLYERGRPGEAYNICSGKGTKVGDIVKILVGMAKTGIKVEQERRRMRIVDDAIYIGDNKKLRSLGWKPQIRLEQSLREILDYWRRKINGK